jgi:MoaA/NifB/PqqE/SkfB family radical SAM enzyme
MNITNYRWDVPVENKTSIENYFSTSLSNQFNFSIFRPLCYFHFPRSDITKLFDEDISKFIGMNSTGKPAANFGSSRFLIRNESFGTVIYDKAYFRYFLLNTECKDLLKQGILCESHNFQKEILLILKLADIPLPLLSDALSICDKENTYYNSPFKVFFEITSKCNMNCRHCLNKGLYHKQINMPIKTIFQYFEKFQESKVSEVNITGGEPFMHPHITQILDYAIKIFPGLTISTNGSMLNISILKFLREINLRYINISLDGTEKTYNITRRGHEFKKIFANVILASKYLPNTGITITLNRYNIQEIEAIIELASLNHIQKINFGLTKRSYCNGNNDLLVESSELLYKCLDKIETLCNLNDITYYLPPDLPFNSVSMQKFANQYLDQNQCNAGIFSLKLLADETVMPCAFFHKKILYKSKDCVMADLFSQIRCQVTSSNLSKNRCLSFDGNCKGGCPSRHGFNNSCDEYCTKPLNNARRG